MYTTCSYLHVYILNRNIKGGHLRYFFYQISIFLFTISYFPKCLFYMPGEHGSTLFNDNLRLLLKSWCSQFIIHLNILGRIIYFKSRWVYILDMYQTIYHHHHHVQFKVYFPCIISFFHWVSEHEKNDINKKV